MTLLFLSIALIMIGEVLFFAGFVTVQLGILQYINDQFI